MNDKNPVNDVSDHYSKHVGLPTEKVEMKKMPKRLRFIGYFLFGGMVVAAAIYIVGIILTYF